MGLLTLADFRDEAFVAFDQRSDLNPTTTAGATFWNRRVNEAYLQVARPNVYRHPTMQKSDTVTLADGKDSYTLPTNLFAIEFIVNETKEDRYNPKLAREFFDQPGGSPRRWARRARELLIRADSSVDGDTVRIYYWAHATRLTADDQATELEDYWDEAVIVLAAGRGARMLGAMEKSDFFASEGAKVINEVKQAADFEAMDRGWRNDPSPVNPIQKVR